MDSIVLSLPECVDGRHIFHGDRMLFWLAEYESAVHTSMTVAEVHADIRKVSASMEMVLLGEDPVHVVTLSPERECVEEQCPG